MQNARHAPRKVSLAHRSPNHTERRGVRLPDMIVLHYTGMETAMAAIERLCDPAAEVSAHYVVDLNGEIFALVDEERRAWHAGRSQWGGVTDVNSHSIGIEIANPGHHLGYPPFPEPQMASVEWLVAQAMLRWSIMPERVVGHACVAPGRKIDPGEKFDWARLARAGLAIFDECHRPASAACEAATFRAHAIRIGYAAPDSVDWTPDLLNVWHAFAMRFLPGRANLPPDAAGVAVAAQVANRWPCIDPTPSTA